MLIFNLQLIQPISEIKSFRELAIREGFEKFRHGTGIVIVGVDARWTHSCSIIILLTGLLEYLVLWVPGCFQRPRPCPLSCWPESRTSGAFLPPCGTLQINCSGCLCIWWPWTPKDQAWKDSPCSSTLAYLTFCTTSQGIWLPLPYSMWKYVLVSQEFYS